MRKGMMLCCSSVLCPHSIMHSYCGVAAEHSTFPGPLRQLVRCYTSGGKNPDRSLTRKSDPSCGCLWDSCLPSPRRFWGKNRVAKGARRFGQSILSCSLFFYIYIYNVYNVDVEFDLLV